MFICFGKLNAEMNAEVYIIVKHITLNLITLKRKDKLR